MLTVAVAKSGDPAEKQTSTRGDQPPDHTEYEYE